MKLSQRTIFSLLLFGVVLSVLLATLHLGPVARLVPLKVVLPTLALLILQLILDLAADRGKRSKLADKMGLSPPKQDTAQLDSQADSAGQKPVTWLRELAVIGWVALLLALIAGLGYLVGAPIFLFLYFKNRVAQGWLVSILVAGLSALVLHLLFVNLLDIPLP